MHIYTYAHRNVVVCEMIRKRTERQRERERKGSESVCLCVYERGRKREIEKERMYVGSKFSLVHARKPMKVKDSCI